MSKYLELPWGVEDTIENMRKLKEVLQKICITDNLDGRGEKDAEEIAFDFDRAINALEEIQKYRAIGTPEECRAAAKTIKSMMERNLTTEIVTEYMKFEDECVKQGFSFNSLLEAREKQTAKKPIRNDKCTCPSCGTHNDVFKKRRNTVAHDIVYCWHCGQAVEIDRLEGCM